MVSAKQIFNYCVFLVITYLYLSVISKNVDILIFVDQIFIYFFVFHSLGAALSSQANKDSYKPIYTFKGLCGCILYMRLCLTHFCLHPIIFHSFC